MSRIKLGIASIFIALFSFAVVVEAATTTPMYFTLRMKIALQLGGELNGRHRVNVKIIGTNSAWQEEYANVLFVNSQCSILIGGGRVPLTIENLRGTTPRVEVTLPEISAVTPLRFPLPATAYAIQARVAEEVKSVDASVVHGPFTSTVNIQNDLIVNTRTLIVDGSTGRVAIATTNISNSAYALNVGGAINATGFTINGENVENALSWRISDGNLFYRDGFVGIATSNPQYALDIQGTLNARAILINQRDIKEELQDQLSWKRNGSDIYFDEGIISDAGFVGIGTSTPQEKLDVRGGVRIGPWVSRSGENPQEGTMQYVETGLRGDFQGYTREGWKSLIGIQGGGSPNRLVYWTGSTELGSANDLYWDETKGLLGVGLGSGTPNARLDVKGSTAGDALMTLRNSNNQSIFHVGQRYVGIGKSNPEYPLDVNGVVNASSYKLNGAPLNLSLSSGTFWQLENERRLYYDLGNVGIGTTAPRNLLEISSASSNPSITFDIEDEDLFTMGIDRLNPSAFVISQGGDLSRPIFSFFGDRIGVGTNRPTANLHVSGNSGMVVEGQFGATTALPSVGAGTKLLWIPKKSAFRVGRVLSNKWDESKLGDYSVAMGYDPEASGIGSVVGGGLSNTASGNYSVVPGGFSNRAVGDFSYAAGHNAFARHRGSFVWSDYQPSVNAFQSSQPNQFLIRASGGVGIGTSDTSEAVLTISKSRQQAYLMKAIGNNGNVGMVITTSGNVGFGTTNPGTSGLAVMNGRVGIGTTDPTANLHVVGSGAGALMFAVSAKNQRNSTASILINDTGLVAIGYTLGHVFDSNKTLDVNGAIIGKSFAIETEDGIITLTPSPGSPWSQPTPERNNVTFYNLGNVGIGTATPNSLLELSNQNVSGNAPYITFDINNTDITTMGPTRNSNGQWLFAIHSGSTVGRTPPIVIGSRNVGIGIGLRTPIAPLHVSGNMVLDGKLAVGTTNFGTYAMNVGGALNVSNIFVNGRSVLPLPVDPWSTAGSNIFYTAGNVGIGTSTGLTSRLVVNGTVSTNRLVINNEFRLSGDLITSRLRLLDNQFASGLVSGSIRINQGNLQYTNPSGNIQVLSSPLQKGTGTSGNVSFFVDSTHLGVTDIFWNSTAPKLAVSGNLLVKRRVIDTGVDITSTVSIGASDSILVQSKLNHDGNLSTVKGYSAEKINLNVLKNWGNINSAVDVVGMNILLRSLNSSFFLNNASAIGLRVDVSSVNANVAEGGSKYAAIFLGGNVGIGTQAPTAELEVVGTVSANFFTLSGGLNVPEININGSTLVARSVDGAGGTLPRVGIGITNPEEGTAELQVRGTISANSTIITGGLIASTLNISNGSTSTLFINTSGNIGIGTNTPDGQIVLRKSLTSATEAYLGEKIQVSINGAQPGNRFFFDRDITGLDVRLSSGINNQLAANATGLKVDLRNLNAVTQSKLTGLHVDVTGQTGTRYAAIFTGGRVGIGTDRPSADLHVAGDIIADNLFLEGFISSQRATFNRLAIRDSATFNGTISVNRIVVQESLSVNTLSLLSDLTAPSARIFSLTSRTASINGLLKARTVNVVTTLNALSGVFTRLGVNTAAPATGVRVSGNIIANALTIADELLLTSGTLNINSGTLFVGANRPNRVGIGTLTPTAPLHIQFSSSATFLPELNTSWQGLRIQTGRTDINSAAGILLTTSTQSPSSSVGAGIAAVRSNAELSTPGSHLVFITDPTTGASAERMRITDAGNVGIGVTDPTAKLQVNGLLLVSGNITANILQAGTIQGIGSVVTINTGGILGINGRTSMNSSLILKNGLYLGKTATPSAIGTLGRLFVSLTDSHLYFMRPGSSVPINISLPLTGASNRIPYFNSTGSLSDNADLFWLDNARTFQVGTRNALTKVAIVATLNTQTSGNVALQQIRMFIPDRSNLTAQNTFTGLDIDFEGDQGVGRLGDGETARGLFVDLRNLRARQSSIDGSTLDGFKYGALFLGGGVGVGTTTPQASLHVVGEVLGNYPLRIDTIRTANAFVVAPNGYVGIGTSAPDAQLTVRGISNDASRIAFAVRTSANTSVMVVRNNGRVGLGGITAPTTALDVNGTIQATTGLFGSITGTTLNIGSGKFFVGANGRIGIGTTAPTGNISISKSINLSNVAEINSSTGYIAEKIDLTLAATGEASLFNFTKPVTGFDINLASGSGSRLGGGATTVNAIGLDIDASTLTLASRGRLVGLDVDVQGTGGTRYAAIFQGGRVGIGTTQPAVELHVSGDIRATSLILSGGLQVNNATYNRVTVTGLTTFTATVNAGLLQARTISVNRLNITGSLVVSTASITTLNISSFASAQTLAIGRLSVQSGFALDVSGNMNVSRNLTIGTTLNVNTIQPRSGSVIRLESPSVLVKSTVSANGQVRVGTGVFLKQTALGTVIPADATRGALYVSSNGHLEYRKPGATVPLILSQALSGDSGKIPYFDNTGNLNDDAPLHWDNILRRLKIGSANVLSTIQLVTSLNNSVTGNFIGQQIVLGLGNRASVAGSSAKFTGLDILFRGQNSTSQFDFGRLAENETAIGLNVDVSTVRARFSSSVNPGSDADRTGIKYAALFKGGSVGVGVTAPLAGLHVASEVAGRTAFRVDSFSRTNAFLVNPDGRVGINTDTPLAQFHVVASSNTTGYALQIVNSANASIMAITNTSRIGIGTRNVQAALHIFSDPSPLRIDAGTDKLNSLFVNGNGLVGMGTNVPSASLHVVGPSSLDSFRISITGGPQYAMLADSAGEVGIGISQPEFKLHVDGVIMSGTANATHGFTSVPSWIRNKPDTTKGFLVNSGTANVFVGVRQSDTADSIESVLFYQNDFKFQRRNTATRNTTIMTLKRDGKIGIGTTLPIAGLHVSGNNRAVFIAGVGATPNALVVTANGRVGINIANPSSLFHVNGALMANTIQITQGTVAVTTVNVSGNLNVAVTANANRNVTAQAISVRINNDITQDVVGLDISMRSNTDPSILPLGSRKYAIYNGGVAYGIRVDLRDVGITPLSILNNNGSRFAATFLGGNVGIGVTNPGAALHVQATDPSEGDFNRGVDIARFATSQSDLTIRDYDQGQMGFIVRNLESGSTASNNYFPLSFAAGAPAGANGPGFVGIGITNPDKTLVVNGDIRVGAVDNSNPVAAAANYGHFLYFSGGPDMGGSPVDSDNSDPIFFARYNAAEDKSELRLNVGRGSVVDADDKFLIGWTSDGSVTGQYNKVVDMRMDGRVGIGDTLASTFSPATVLHVVGTKSGAAETLANHVMLIENKGSTDADSLAIYHSGTSNVNVSSNFVTFFDNTGIVGKISGNGSDGGVRFVSQGADYAEYLAKRDKSESIEKGDIVGVFNGLVTKKTAGAQQIMAKSSGASVAGNYPGEKGRSDFSLVAFFGQVKIKVVGPVALGDFVVPSGREDGTGIAVSPENIHRYAKSRIVGRAWEASTSQEMKLINTAVGFNFSMPELDREFAMVHSLESELKTLKAERHAMEKSINDRLEQQNKEIERLTKQLKP